jgi:Cu+-exporting ATPase
MGLATPAAIMAGVNVAARRGILIRDGVALEKSGAITAIVFDKTGTLTEGRPVVVTTLDFRPPDSRTPSLPALAAALAGPSQHPLSRAVTSWAPQEMAGSEPAEALQEWREVRGLGVEARRETTTLRLGSPDWLRGMGIDLTAAETFLGAQTHGGATVLFLTADETVLGAVALRDELKEGAPTVLAALQQQGRAVYLLTGDNRHTAGAVAALAGVPPVNVYAGVRPEQKAERVKLLQAAGARVAFVGDGINDAPALEQADLGIVVSRASDVAKESADIILLTADLEAIPEALGLAQATLRTIKQNLFWAFFYNAAAIPLAALGFFSPIVSAAAMGLSDVIVIGNALRLRRWRMKK